VSGSAAAAAFSAHAHEYTALRRRLVPRFDAFYGAVIDVLGLLEPAPARVLDIGAGTGLLSAQVVEAFPGVGVELLDASEPMVREAHERLGNSVAAVHAVDMTAALPDGPYDAVVSALAIHHLEDPDKRALFDHVHERLRPGGVFVNAEQVASPSPALADVYEQMWVRDCRALGASETELNGAHERMRHDRCADVEAQLGWLRQAGFAPVDCVYKSWRFAVMAAFKEDGE
jgi:tRNA (cmo5U34)-methyltransferase